MPLVSPREAHLVTMPEHGRPSVRVLHLLCRVSERRQISEAVGDDVGAVALDHDRWNRRGPFGALSEDSLLGPFEIHLREVRWPGLSKQIVQEQRLGLDAAFSDSETRLVTSDTANPDTTRGRPDGGADHVAAAAIPADVPPGELCVSTVEFDADDARVRIGMGKVRHGQADVCTEVPDQMRRERDGRQMRERAEDIAERVDVGSTAADCDRATRECAYRNRFLRSGQHEFGEPAGVGERPQSPQHPHTAGVDPGCLDTREHTTRAVTRPPARLPGEWENHESISVVVACEVAKHIENPAAALAEICRGLTSDGILVIPTPQRGDRPADLRHVHEFAPCELRELCAKFFAEVTVWVAEPRWLVRVYRRRSRRWSLNVPSLHGFNPIGVTRRLRSRPRLRRVQLYAPAAGPLSDRPEAGAP